MKLHFLELPPDDRRLYIEQAALRRDVSPVIMVMAFWMCWLLGILIGADFAAGCVPEDSAMRHALEHSPE